MPQKVLISKYVNSIPDNPGALIAVLQYSWGASVENQFEFEVLKSQYAANDGSGFDVKEFNNVVRDALVGRIEGVASGFKDLYDSKIPADVTPGNYKKVKVDVLAFLSAEVVKLDVADVDAMLPEVGGGGGGAAAKKDVEKYKSVPAEAKWAMVSMLEMSRLKYHLESFPEYQSPDSYGEYDSIQGRSCTLMFSGAKGLNVPVELFQQEDKKNRIGIMLDPGKVEIPHMDFVAYRSGAMVNENAEQLKRGLVTDGGMGNMITGESQFSGKKGVTRSGMGMTVFAANHAKWERETETYHKKGTAEIAAKAVWRKYFKDTHKLKDGKLQWTDNYGGQDAMRLNEAIIFQKADVNPVAGIFINVTGRVLPLKEDLKEIIAILKQKPHLELYVYDTGRQENIVRHCNNPTVFLTALIEAASNVSINRVLKNDEFLQPFSGVVAAGAEVAPLETIGDQMRIFKGKEGCEGFLGSFRGLDLEGQKKYFKLAWGGGDVLERGVISGYDALKEGFVAKVAEMSSFSTVDKLNIQQIFNDEMRNSMLQIMAKQEDRQEFVAGYRKALGDYDGTFFADDEYKAVRKEMRAFIEEDKMPQRVLISDYVASIPDDPGALIEALQYAWNVGGSDKFGFENLKKGCEVTKGSVLEVKMAFNNSVRGGLVSRIEQIVPGFKKEYDDLILPLESDSATYDDVAEEVREMLQEAVGRLRPADASAVGGGGVAVDAAVDDGTEEAVDNAVEPGGYEFMISVDTLVKVRDYKKTLESADAGDPKIGVYLAFNILKNKGRLPVGINEGYFRYIPKANAESKKIDDDLRRQAQALVKDFTTEDFLELLIKTKRPQIFAESAIKADAKFDWNEKEISILGDVNCAVDVTIYDNGLHKLTKASDVHNDPFAGALLFSPGALLRGAGGQADISEVVEGGTVNQEKLNALYERRLLPLLLHANQDAAKNDKKAFVTLPGMGCGCFAGSYEEGIKPKFKNALEAIIATHKDKLTNVAGVYLDLYDSTELNGEVDYGDTRFISHALTTPANNGKPQLCHPREYGADENCKLYSVVAWDHVSWPGNDYYPGSRATDDGVKAAATDSMTKFTGVKGAYVPHPHLISSTNGYEAVNGKEWLDCIKERKVDLMVKGNVVVLEGEVLKKLNGNETEDRDIVGTAPVSVDVPVVASSGRGVATKGADFFTNPQAGGEAEKKLKAIRARFSRVGYYQDDGSNNYFIRFSSKKEAQKFSEKLQKSYEIVGSKGGAKVAVPTKSNGAPVYDNEDGYDYDSEQAKEYAIILTDKNYETFAAKEASIKKNSEVLGEIVKPFQDGAEVTDCFFFDSEENYRIDFDDAKKALSFAEKISLSGIKSGTCGQKAVILDFFDGDRQVRGYLNAGGDLQVSGEGLSYSIDTEKGVVYRDDSDQAIKISSSHVIFNEGNRELFGQVVTKAQLEVEAALGNTIRKSRAGAVDTEVKEGEFDSKIAQQVLLDTYDSGVGSKYHGGDHAIRVVLLMEDLLDLHEEIVQFESQLQSYTPIEKTLLKYAALFHDSGRGGADGMDSAEMEKESAHLFVQEMMKIFPTKEDLIKKVATDAIVGKDKGENKYNILLHTADVIEVMRTAYSNERLIEEGTFPRKPQNANLGTVGTFDSTFSYLFKHLKDDVLKEKYYDLCKKQRVLIDRTHRGSATEGEAYKYKAIAGGENLYDKIKKVKAVLGKSMALSEPGVALSTSTSASTPTSTPAQPPSPPTALAKQKEAAALAKAEVLAAKRTPMPAPKPPPKPQAALAKAEVLAAKTTPMPPPKPPPKPPAELVAFSKAINASVTTIIQAQVAKPTDLEKVDVVTATGSLFTKNLEAQANLVSQYEALADDGKTKSKHQELYGNLQDKVVSNPEEAVQTLNLRNFAATLTAAANYFSASKEKSGEKSLANRSSIEKLYEALLNKDISGKNVADPSKKINERDYLEKTETKDQVKKDLAESFKIKGDQLESALRKVAKRVRQAAPSRTFTVKEVKELLSTEAGKSK